MPKARERGRMGPRVAHEPSDFTSAPFAGGGYVGGLAATSGRSQELQQRRGPQLLVVFAEFRLRQPQFERWTPEFQPDDQQREPRGQFVRQRQKLPLQQWPGLQLRLFPRGQHAQLQFRQELRLWLGPGVLSRSRAR